MPEQPTQQEDDFPYSLNASQEGVTLSVGTPKWFTLEWKLLANIVGISIVLPPYLLLILIGLLGLAGVLPYQVHAVLALGLFILVPITMYFIPFLNVNWWIRKKVLESGQRLDEGLDRFIVQMTTEPRIQQGKFEGFLEDADDIGVLFIEKDHLRFSGDFIEVRVPFEKIFSMTFERAGARTMWVGPRKIRFLLDTERPEKILWLYCREGLTLPGARKIERRMISTLHRRMDEWLRTCAPIHLSRPQKPEERYPLG